MNEGDDPVLRKKITDLLAKGLVTKVEPFPVTEKEFGEITAELRALDRDDVKGKLIVGGFIDHPYGPDNWRCMECIYYLVNRKWCDLPELAIPVEADWYCKLWRM